jgi:hypothetical protein
MANLVFTTNKCTTNRVIITRWLLTVFLRITNLCVVYDNLSGCPL